MIDPMLAFFALYFGYIALAIWLGWTLGRRLTRNWSRPLQYLAQLLSIAVLLYLPVWDYVPGKILFDRECRNSGGLQIDQPLPSTWVALEGVHPGYCPVCLRILSTGLATEVESRVRLTNAKREPSLLEHDGIVRFRLVPRPHPACERFDAYLMEWASVASIGRLTPQEAFWAGLPKDLRDDAGDVCPDWEFIEKVTAPLLLTDRRDSKPRFFWTYLYRHRVELKSISDGSIASYATYQYHPWFNAALFDGAPRLFIFRCPEPTAAQRWEPNFWPSQLFVELFRHHNDKAVSK